MMMMVGMMIISGHYIIEKMVCIWATHTHNITCIYLHSDTDSQSSLSLWFWSLFVYLPRNSFLAIIIMIVM